MKQKTFRLPKNKKITVSDILGQNEVNSLLNDVIAEKGNIDGLVIIQQDKEGRICWKKTGFSCLEVIGLLEQVKQWELDDDYELDD